MLHGIRELLGQVAYCPTHYEAPKQVLFVCSPHKCPPTGSFEAWVLLRAKFVGSANWFRGGALGPFRVIWGPPISSFFVREALQATLKIGEASPSRHRGGIDMQCLGQEQDLSCSRPCLVHACMHACTVERAPCKLLLPFIAYCRLPLDSSRPYTRGSLINTPGQGVQVLLHIASANFCAFTSIHTAAQTIGRS
eukprot:1157751-Pelagomonas_calceolata.AAC.5